MDKKRQFPYLEYSVHDDGDEHVEEDSADVLDAITVEGHRHFFARLGPVHCHVVSHGDEQLRHRLRYLED